jgi:hypothetical protein
VDRSDGEFGVERLRGDGTLDTTFGISGLALGRSIRPASATKSLRS